MSLEQLFSSPQQQQQAFSIKKKEKISSTAEYDKFVVSPDHLECVFVCVCVCVMLGSLQYFRVMVKIRALPPTYGPLRLG